MTKLLVIALTACSTAALAATGVEQKAGQITFTIDGKPFTTFHYGPDTAKPYLWPLRTADGTVITRNWPLVKDVAGESHDHPHQRGLWFSHGDVNGSDFWANEPEAEGKRKGHIKAEDGSVQCGSSGHKAVIEGKFDWLDADGVKLLTEHRMMTLYDDPVNRIIDFDIDLKADRKVTFGDTKEGTFAMRLADSMTEKRHGGQLVNAAGAHGMDNVWGKRSPWVDYSGKVGDKTVGVAIFDNPDNPRHPTYWHARDYGLFAANIFGLHDFLNDKSQNGSLTLEPGQTVRFRYRVVIHPGDVQTAHIAKLYEAYKDGK